MESSLLDLLATPPVPETTTASQYVLVAQADPKTAVRSSITNFNAVFEVCQPVETQTQPVWATIVPTDELLNTGIFPRYQFESGNLRAKVSVLESPKYGRLVAIPYRAGGEISDKDPATYKYAVHAGTPNGTEDRVVFLVEIGGKRLKVVERLIMVFNSTPESTECNGKDYYVRRISRISEETAPAPLAYSALNPYLLLQQSANIGVTYAFHDISGPSVGQITLDTNTAGHALSPERSANASAM